MGKRRLTDQERREKRKVIQNRANKKYYEKNKNDPYFKEMKKKAAKLANERYGEIYKERKRISTRELRKDGRKYSLKEKLGYTKKNAATRDKEWKIGDEFAIDLFQQECIYCGEQPIAQEQKWNGIDRMDNDLGYLEENCAPCCWNCNQAKGKKHAAAFITMCMKIADRWKKFVSALE